MRRLALLAAFAVLFFAPPSAHAAIISLNASRDGLQEVPPNASPATGTAAITFDDVSNLLSWTITYFGLVARTSNAHFHGPAAPGVSASPVVNIPFTVGVTAKTLIGSAVITATGETQLLAGRRRA